MLKCSVFLGCFGNCAEEITAGITIQPGTYSYKYYFNDVEFSGTVEVTEENKLTLPNVFTPSHLHTVKIYNSENVLIETICFKITTACKEIIE